MTEFNAKNNGAHNKSMDVRAKQLLCLERRPSNSNGLGGGFAPRHLSRSTSSLDVDIRFMKQFFLKTTATILTFILGLSLTWFWLQFSQFSFACVSLSNISLLWRVQPSLATFASPNARFNDGVKVTFEKVEPDKHGKHLVIRVQNTGREAIYFDGWLNSPCSYQTKNKAAQEHTVSCECVFGLSRQILLGGESVRFRVEFSGEIEKARVGYSFKIKDNEPAQTFWSGEITIREE